MFLYLIPVTLSRWKSKEKQQKMTIHLTYQKQDINARNPLTNFQKVTDFKKDYFLSLTAFATDILWQWFLAFVIKILVVFPTQ